MSGQPKAKTKKRPTAVLVTGAAGYIGRLALKALVEDPRSQKNLKTIVATDVRDVPADQQLPGVVYETLDVRSPALAERLRAHEIDTVVHLAALVTPPAGATRELARSIDVDGTRNVLAACVESGARRFIVTSSGAAYGYHADNPALLSEDDALRGNEAFAYSHHKRLVEEMLARYREEHPKLEQIVFRPGTVLGEGTRNQITAIFERRVVVGLRGADVPFTFIWDEDVAFCIVDAVHGGPPGTYNLAGDGVMPLAEIAKAMGRPFVALPTWALTGALTVLEKLGVGPYGPEQVCFLRYRPVMSNERLKSEFGYQPRKTTREAFDVYRAHLAH